MSHANPLTDLRTHSVTNQPPPLEDYNLFTSDKALVEAVEREGAGWANERISEYGALMGSAEMIENGFLANKHLPELKTHDRFGHRVDEVVFHPSYHALMAAAKEHSIHSIAWQEKRAGGHVAHTALEYISIQTESGICCPITMTYAAVPTMAQGSEALRSEWEEKLFLSDYDPSFAPISQKKSITMGMAMTEKQGGSDVRANSTKATPLGAGGPGEEYHLTGHKWFCSAPMCDAFFTLAYAEDGLSCFFVPRWLPDGTRNPFYIQRLKDKLGNKSNASSEIEYDKTWALMVGEPGRGVRTIMEMVHHTRLDCAMATAAIMRQCVTQAIHHTSHRTAFQKKLVDQPLMRNVLADIAVEAEAALHFVMRIARSFDEAASSDEARAFSRLIVAIGKYWTSKRVPGLSYEAMECFGGPGYVEETMMPRLYREAPLNSIWEGSGNVMCLDILRTFAKEPIAFELLMSELGELAGDDARLSAAVGELRDLPIENIRDEAQARRHIEKLALTYQGALLVNNAPHAVSDAFCASRLEGDWGLAYGTLPTSVNLGAIIERAAVR